MTTSMTMTQTTGLNNEQMNILFSLYILSISHLCWIIIVDVDENLLTKRAWKMLLKICWKSDTSRDAGEPCWTVSYLRFVGHSEWQCSSRPLRLLLERALQQESSNGEMGQDMPRPSSLYWRPLHWLQDGL